MEEQGKCYVLGGVTLSHESPDLHENNKILYMLSVVGFLVKAGKGS